MTAPPAKDPASWQPLPEESPPVEERARNLVRHFALILAVLLALAAPVALAWMGRQSSVPGNSEKR